MTPQQDQLARLRADVIREITVAPGWDMEVAARLVDALIDAAHPQLATASNIIADLVEEIDRLRAEVDAKDDALDVERLARALVSVAMDEDDSVDGDEHGVVVAINLNGAQGDLATAILAALKEDQP